MASSLLSDPSSYLTNSDHHEEDDFPEDYWYRTKQTCDSCGENICFDEDIFLIQVVTAWPSPLGINTSIVMKDSGDFEFKPVLLHEGCWEYIDDEYRELIADEPRRIDINAPPALLYCMFCELGIPQGLMFGRITIGQITLSELRNQEKFEELPGMEDKPVCVDCLSRINDQCITFWTA